MPEPTNQYVERIVDKAVKLIQKRVPVEEWPDNLQQIFNRLETIHNLRCKYMYKGEAFIREVYRTAYPDLNDTTIRQDMRVSEEFYGRTRSGKREYDRVLHLEFLKKAQYRAFENGNDKAAAMYAKLIQNYLDPRFDPLEKPDFMELAKAMNITVEFNPELLGIERIDEEEKKALWERVQSKLSIEIADAEFDELPPSVKKRELDNE